MSANKKYEIIYADPAWTYNVWSKKGAGRTASHHYDVMTLEDMKRMPIRKISAENSVCFMWITYPNLIDGVKLLHAWGFEFKTVAFTWVKLLKKWEERAREFEKKQYMIPDDIESLFKIGMGYYTRANPEICILGTRGKPLPRQSKSVRNFIASPIREHSRKPDEIRDRIVELFGDLPRIELFARASAPGWDSHGNQKTKFNEESTDANK